MASNVAKVDQMHPQTDRLDQALHRLVQPEVLSYDMPLAIGQEGRDLFCTLLREIDETILPRQILLECQPHGTVRLSVSNRRLAKIELDHDIAAVQIPSFEGTAEMAKQFAQKLKELFASAKTARLLRPVRLPAHTTHNMSCSIRLLAEAAELTDWRTHLDQTSAAFLDVVNAVAVATWCLGSDDADADETGTADEVELLKEFYRNYQSGQQKRSAQRSFNPNEAQCLLVPLSHARTVVLTTIQRRTSLAMVPSDQIRLLTQAWRGTTTDIKT